MHRRTLLGLAGLALLLGGCGLSERVDDFAWRTEETPLQRVLVAADDTPGNQGLLYTAIREAEAAQHSAVRARLAADDAAEARQGVGEVLYAVSPPAAPDWEAMATGIVPGWGGQGYGVLRASRELAEALRLAAEGEPADAGEAARRALVCAENTIQRSEQILDLGRRALEGGAGIPASTLQRIETLARELNQGRTTAPDVESTACGLERAVRILEGLAVSPTAV